MMIAGQTVATIHANWYWDNEEEAVMCRNPRKFNWGAAFLTGLSVGLGLLVLMVIYYNGNNVPYDPVSGSLIAFVMAAFVGAVFWFFPGIDEVDYIKIREHKGGATILLKKYDDDGRRNLDEDEIMHIIEAFRDAKIEGGA
jgi:hypothetical protein